MSSMTKKKKIEKTPQDYLSWGRDSRHRLDNSEKMPSLPSRKPFFLRKIIAFKFKTRLKRKKIILPIFPTYI